MHQGVVIVVVAMAAVVMLRIRVPVDRNRKKSGAANRNNGSRQGMRGDGLTTKRGRKMLSALSPAVSKENALELAQLDVALPTAGQNGERERTASERPSCARAARISTMSQ